MAKSTQVLILGGTGIIGSDLVSAVLQRGHQVYVASRGQKASRLPAEVISITVDVYDSTSFVEAIKNYKFDTVIDLLSFNGQQLATNIELVKDKCQQYIFVSSATIYDAATKDQGIKEDHRRVTQGWDYPLSKIEAEKVLREVCSQANMAYTIIRPYIVYSDKRLSFGQWEGFNVIDSLMQNKPVVIGEELAKVRTTLTHSSDLARGIAGLIANPLARNTDFHVTSEEVVTWQEVYRIAADALGQKLTIVDVPITTIIANFPELSGKIDDRLKTRVFDNTKLKQAVPDFSCQYNVKQGYVQALKKVDASSLPPIDLVLQGRIDRLIFDHADNHTRTSLTSYQATLKRASIKNYLRYTIGYHPSLRLSLKRLKKVIKGASPPDYYAVHTTAKPRV